MFPSPTMGMSSMMEGHFAGRSSDISIQETRRRGIHSGAIARQESHL